MERSGAAWINAPGSALSRDHLDTLLEIFGDHETAEKALTPHSKGSPLVTARRWPESPKRQLEKALREQSEYWKKQKDAETKRKPENLEGSLLPRRRRHRRRLFHPLRRELRLR